MATRNSTSDRFAFEGITFDDVLLVPAYSEILPRDTSLRTRLTRNIEINVPLISA
ncbi:MAG: IMP dehydrogenase, partial [Chitinophagales bacterium]|nr:IMP dehydrogenase [Chitinophagales bacterium]